jgi:hypothetical protein
MMISEVRVFEMGQQPEDREMEGQPIRPVFFIECPGGFKLTWRVKDDVLPKGRVRGVGLMALKAEVVDGVAVFVPDYLQVDRNMFLNWGKYRWEPHQIRCDNGGVRFAHLTAKKCAERQGKI